MKYISTIFFMIMMLASQLFGADLVANAGEDKTLNVTASNRAIHLDGSESTSSDEIVSYKWYEGDKYIGSGQSRWYVLTQNGEHNITLKVTDSTNETAEDSVIITVVNQVIANAGTDIIVDLTDASDTVQLDGSASSAGENTLSYEWFENGTSLSTEVTFAYAPATVGTHIVTLKVKDNMGTEGEDEVKIVINSIGEVDGLQADAGEDKILNITPSNRAVHLDGSGSSSNNGIVSYKWYEGDKYIGSGKSRWYVLTENGEHTITLKVVDTTGEIAEDHLLITVISSTYGAFKNTLVNKCKISPQVFDDSFDTSTGIYDGNISCRNSGLTDTDMSTFDVLTRVNGNLLFSENSFTNLDGLSNLSVVGSIIAFYKIPTLTNIDGLNSLKRVGYGLGFAVTNIRNLNGLSNLKTISATDGGLAFVKNPNLTDISGLNNVHGIDKQILVIDLNQYTVKAEHDSPFCQTDWDIESVSSNIPDDKKLICEED